MFIFLVFRFSLLSIEVYLLTKIQFFLNFFVTFIFFYYFCITEGSIELWCNGNTTDSGSVFLGSSPSSSTKKGVAKNCYSFLIIIHCSKSRYRESRSRAFLRVRSPRPSRPFSCPTRLWRLGFRSRVFPREGWPRFLRR